MKSPNPFPAELWSLIYLNSQDPIPLLRANRFLRLLLDNPFMISQWIVHRYTLEFAFLGALNWYLSKSHICTADNCDFENRQIQVSKYLLSMNLLPTDLEAYVMTDASKMRHLRYVEWILASQNDSSKFKPRYDLLLNSIDTHDEQLILLLASYKSTTPKAIETAFNRELNPILFNVLLKDIDPSMDLIISCFSRASVSKWYAFKKRQDEIIQRLYYLLQKTSDLVLNENRDQLMISASELGSIILVKYLRERGGNINIERGAPLYTAVLVGNITLIKYLVLLPEISLDIFSIPRASLVIICLIDHMAVLYALISTSISVVMSIICQSQGFVGSTLNILTFTYNNTCTNSIAVQGNLEQQLVGCIFSLILFLLLQTIMPLYGISGSLLYIFLYKRRRNTLIHPAY